MAGLRAFLAVAASSFLLFALIEGASSLVLALADRNSSTGGPMVSRYDSLVGWTTVPDIREPSYWGPGRGLSTDGRGFRRNGAPPDARADSAVTSIVCLGDSFTFGDGVGDSDTWCARLAAARPELEALNLGQPGYGFDQMYLRYRTLADSLDHQTVIVAFISDDFVRMRAAERNGYAKPVLAPIADSLGVLNVPVPRTLPSISRGVNGFARRLGVVRLLIRTLGEAGAVAPAGREERARLEEIVRRSLAHLAERSRAAGRVLVTVHLPTTYDRDRTPRWAEALDRITRELAIDHLGLIPDFRSLGDAEVASMFIPSGAMGGGHFSEAGHAWVSDRLEEWLFADGGALSR